MVVVGILDLFVVYGTLCVLVCMLERESEYIYVVQINKKVISPFF